MLSLQPVNSMRGLQHRLPGHAHNLGMFQLFRRFLRITVIRKRFNLLNRFLLSVHSSVTYLFQLFRKQRHRLQIRQSRGLEPFLHILDHLVWILRGRA